MSFTEEFYKDIILEHFRYPSHCGHLSNPSIKQEGVNRSCGDEVEIELLVEDKKIKDIRVNSRGCSISVASGSMMADAIEGMSISEAKDLIQKFKAMVVEGNIIAIEEEKLEDLKALEGVHRYPIRVKCATLVWSTLQEALKDIENRQKNSLVT